MAVNKFSNSFLLLGTCLWYSFPIIMFFILKVYAKIYYFSLILPKDLWIKVFVSCTKFFYKARKHLRLGDILESQLEWEGKWRADKPLWLHHHNHTPGFCNLPGFLADWQWEAGEGEGYLCAHWALCLISAITRRNHGKSHVYSPYIIKLFLSGSVFIDESTEYH